MGSRKPTPYGLRMARLLAAGCARAKIPVVSGLARGIDTQAHRAALEAGGVTWAVLGSGLDVIYPSENRGLSEEILRKGGAVLSELPDGTGPDAHNFPKRNRIISGLSLGVIVVEGDVRSGSLITARCALAQGREVFAVPGPADSPMSEGPLELIRQGAPMARSIEDVLAELPMLSQGTHPELPGLGPEDSLSADERKIIQFLASGELELEELAAKTCWELPRLLRVLTELEAQELILAVPGQRYARR